MLPAALLSLIAMSTAAPTNPPDISLDTLPTVYYGQRPLLRLCQQPRFAASPPPLPLHAG
jgi:hypothetical protein